MFASNAGGLAIDPFEEKLYWSNDFDEDNILRANFDGTGIETIYDAPGGSGGPSGMDLDLQAGKLYVADSLSPGYLRRMNLDGSALETLFTGGGGSWTKDVDLDLREGKVYFTAFDTIRRANLDGTGLETIVTGLGNAGPYLVEHVFIPEPSSLILLLLGAGLFACGRRRGIKGVRYQSCSAQDLRPATW